MTNGISEETQRLMFEYRELVRENHKNFDMSYRIMRFMVAGSFIALSIIAREVPSFLNSIVLAVAAIALWIAYGIDRRLTFMNSIRNIRLQQIEENGNINIWIQRLNHPYKKICDTINLPDDFPRDWREAIYKSHICPFLSLQHFELLEDGFLILGQLGEGS